MAQGVVDKVVSHLRMFFRSIFGIACQEPLKHSVLHIGSNLMSFRECQVSNKLTSNIVSHFSLISTRLYELFLNVPHGKTSGIGW